jgi:hypothetical protein
VAGAVEIAGSVEQDRKQRAVPVDVIDPALLEELRLLIRDAAGSNIEETLVNRLAKRRAYQELAAYLAGQGLARRAPHPGHGRQQLGGLQRRNRTGPRAPSSTP